MSRDPSGVYTLPTGNPVVSGTIIESNWANPTMSDIGNALTDSVSRSGKGGMLAPLRLQDGTQSIPGLAFLTELGTGFYREGTLDFRFAMGGDDVTRWKDGVFEVWTGLAWSAINGTYLNTDEIEEATPDAGVTVEGVLIKDGALQGGQFPSGTKMLFASAAAPVGWTKDTANNNKALRLTSGTGGGAGGNLAFTTVFSSNTITTSAGSHNHGGTQPHALTKAQMPKHAHGGPNNGFVTHLSSGGSVLDGGNDFSVAIDGATNNTGGGGSHTHAISSSGTTHAHATNMSVQYVDVIIASCD